MDDLDDSSPFASGTGPVESAYSPSPQADPRLISSASRRGFFVTFEGIEGSGKTTQLGRLAERLLAGGEPVLATREPGGSPLGRQLRAILLAEETVPIGATAELLLYVADRAQHLHDVIEPALAAGTHVLCDRFLEATLAYQGYARGIDLDFIRALHRRPPLDRRPDRTILLDIEPDLGLRRARRRNEDLAVRGADGPLTLFAAPLENAHGHRVHHTDGADDYGEDRSEPRHGSRNAYLRNRVDKFCTRRRRDLGI